MARNHPRWDKRVIRSLSDEESVDPNGEWSHNAPREDQGCEWSHIWDVGRVVAHDFASTSFGISRKRIPRVVQGKALFIHILLGPSVAPVERSPNEATLREASFCSFGLKPSAFHGMEKAPCLFTFQGR